MRKEIINVLIFNPNEYSGRQINFKLPHAREINNVIKVKRIHFQKLCMHIYVYLKYEKFDL